jgi:hypothetical protein
MTIFKLNQAEKKKDGYFVRQPFWSQL